MSTQTIIDRIRDVERRLSPVERAIALIPARKADPPPNRIIRGVAQELIDSEGSGTFRVEGRDRTLTNPYMHALWLGTTVQLDSLSGEIISHDAATIIQATYGGGSTSSVSSYSSWDAASNGHFDATSLTDARFVITDPSGLLADIATSDTVFFAVRKYSGSPVNELRVVSGITSDGGGSTEWPGWPGPTPGTGTTTMMLLSALVDAVSDVSSGAATFSFKSATVTGGLGPDSGAPTSGTCSNCGQAWVDNEPVLVAGNGTLWQAFKGVPNRIYALVNEANHVKASDAEFDFDGGVVLAGTIKDSGIAVNSPPQIYLDNEIIELEQRNDKKWTPRKLVINANVVGLVIADVDAATADGTAGTCAPGVVASAVKLLTWSGTGFTAVANGTVACVNLSFTAIRGSLTEPIVCNGRLEAVTIAGNDSIGFVPTSIFDFRALPGYVVGSNQIPFHLATEPGFQLDSESCPSP